MNLKYCTENKVHNSSYQTDDDSAFEISCFSLFVHSFLVLNCLPDGGSLNKWCPGPIVSLKIFLALLTQQVL